MLSKEVSNQYSTYLPPPLTKKRQSLSSSSPLILQYSPHGPFAISLFYINRIQFTVLHSRSVYAVDEHDVLKM